MSEYLDQLGASWVPTESPAPCRLCANTLQSALLGFGRCSIRQSLLIHFAPVRDTWYGTRYWNVWINWVRASGWDWICPFFFFSCPGSSIPTLADSLTATLGFQHKFWLLRLETLQTFDQSDEETWPDEKNTCLPTYLPTYLPTCPPTYLF